MRRDAVMAMDYATIYEMALKIRWRQEKAERRRK
jgi:hypothetical protein